MFSKLPSQVLVLALIASLLTNQCLCSAHAHVGMGMEEAADHARRPHVHLGAAHQHHHGASAHSHPSTASHVGPGVSAKKLVCAAGVAHEHDADAFYFASGPSLDRNRSASGSGQANDELAAQSIGWIAPPLWGIGCDDQRFHPPPGIGRSSCALYLLHLSIRC